MTQRKGGNWSSTTLCSGQTCVSQDNPVTISPNRGEQAPHYLCTSSSQFVSLQGPYNLMRIKNKIPHLESVVKRPTNRPLHRSPAPSSWSPAPSEAPPHFMEAVLSWSVSMSSFPCFSRNWVRWPKIKKSLNKSSGNDGNSLTFRLSLQHSPGE